MAGLELQGLHKKFGPVVALHSFDLAVGSGEFVALLGPSGCGKTTALRMVAGFERPDDGRVLVGGQDITAMPPSKRDMGMVFQAYSLFPNLSARDNVAFGLRVRKVARAEQARRALDLLEMVGLAAEAGRYPHQLSGGQQQRVALARALAIQPQVLLLDEPLSALDATVRVQLRNEIRRLQTQLGITTLFVTHDQEEALSISDRVAVLSQGRIEQIGTPAEIYGAPRTVFVAQFVGAMNRIEGVILSGAQGLLQCRGLPLRANAARGWADSTRVLLLIRPEAIDLTRMADGQTPPYAALDGVVKTHTFLGSVTRLTVTSAVGEMMVDVGSTRALSLGLGARVALTWDPEAPRLIDLSEDNTPAPPPALSAAAAVGAER